PIRDYRLRDLRRNMALVGQQVVLFNDTLANNISYGLMDRPSEQEIREAARAANAEEFIDRLPDGFDTVIGENGVMLSGGQRQRVAIARALLKNAPILILDEATSALDSESEHQIQTALDQLMVGRTTLVIAHRLSTIENADRIVVLDQGRVVEAGTHRELLAHGGHYAALHQMQFREE
uniref:ATP-binding cassette domain-containing protein n=1 Tax=Aquisalimonas sp. TaxID=1872621 RepID=UPI0025BD334B